MKRCIIFRTLVLCCVSFCGSLRAANAPSLAADVIIFNAKVITLNSNAPSAQSIAVRGERIMAVGRDKQLQAYKGSDTRMIDAHGQTVLPGLQDSEVYSYAAATSELNGAAPEIRSIAAAQEYIRRQAAQKPAESWIVIDRAYPSRLKEGRLPTKAELDEAAPKNPVFWDSGALSVLNSKALVVSKIAAGFTNPPGGTVVLDPVTKQPTGLLRHASSLVKMPAVRLPTTEQRRDALKHLYQLYNEQGITSICESRAEPEAIDLFRDLSKSGELTVRINCARWIEIGATSDQNLAQLKALTNAPVDKLPYGPTGVGDEWVRIGPLKTHVDGDLLTGTAYLRTPWGIGQTYDITDPAYRGEFNGDPETLAQLFLQGAKSGWQLSAECTGDAALDQLLNCYQKVQFKVDLSERRFLISHAGFQAQEVWSRCKDLGVVACLQPTSLYCDGSSLVNTLGQKRLRNFLPTKSWFDGGLIAGGGSGHAAGLDSLASSNPWNPWLGLWITLTRQTSEGTEIHPEEQLTREQAIRFYTINNAYLNFDEGNKGSLETGKFADLIMIDKDILKCPLSEVRDTKVRLTMVGGKIVWEPKNAAFAQR